MRRMKSSPVGAQSLDLTTRVTNHCHRMGDSAHATVVT